MPPHSNVDFAGRGNKISPTPTPVRWKAETCPAGGGKGAFKKHIRGRSASSEFGQPSRLFNGIGHRFRGFVPILLGDFI
jgi:hypothetical protein